MPTRETLKSLDTFKKLFNFMKFYYYLSSDQWVCVSKLFMELLKCLNARRGMQICMLKQKPL